MKLPMFHEPTPEEDAQMRNDAKVLNDCVSWNKHCKSECCKGFSIEDKGQDLTLQKFRIFGSAMPDMIRYYELHNAKYRMPYLYIPTRNAYRKNGRIWIMETCKALLPDGKCKFHGTLAKPRVCRELNMENIQKGVRYGGGTITDNCLFRFKQEIVEAK